MYVVPIIILVILAIIAVAWSPFFALIVFVPLFLAFLAYVAWRPRPDQTRRPPTGSAGRHEDDRPKGAWGEPR